MGCGSTRCSNNRTKPKALGAGNGIRQLMRASLSLLADARACGFDARRAHLKTNVMTQALVMKKAANRGGLCHVKLKKKALAQTKEIRQMLHAERRYVLCDRIYGMLIRRTIGRRWSCGDGRQCSRQMVLRWMACGAIQSDLRKSCVFCHRVLPVYWGSFG